VRIKEEREKSQVKLDQQLEEFELRLRNESIEKDEEIEILRASLSELE